MSEFESFGKIPRLSREIVITEKIDGTNAQIHIYREIVGSMAGSYYSDELSMKVGSRSRWITPEDDNYGFARWAYENKAELVSRLGEGTHYGEWWGSGIQRGYGLTKGEKRFSLFNTHRWNDPEVRPACCGVVPELYRGVFDTKNIDAVLDFLTINGSAAAPGFMKPEGIIIFHTHGNLMFKKTIDKDEEPKGKANNS